MNIEDIFAKMKAMRAKRVLNSEQLTLGQLIEKVKLLLSQKDKDTQVVHDFGYFSPSEIESWRGSYDELALNYSDTKDITLSQFHDMINDALGKSFEGYKGGDYVMTETTPIWVANYGNSGHTAVIDIIDAGHQIVILTHYMEY